MVSKSLFTREEIADMYNDGLSSYKIAEKTNLSPRGVRYILNELGVEMRKSGKPREHEVNEFFFDTWSREMAWVLGLIVTDGCISKNKLILIQKDTELLKVVASKMKAELVISKKTKTKKLRV